MHWLCYPPVFTCVTIGDSCFSISVISDIALADTSSKRHSNFIMLKMLHTKPLASVVQISEKIKTIVMKPHSKIVKQLHLHESCYESKIVSQ